MSIRAVATVAFLVASPLGLAAVSDKVSSARRLNAPKENADPLQELLDAINPAYLIIIGCLILAGCAFELAYGTRGSSGRTDWSHVASRQQPYSVTSTRA